MRLQSRRVALVAPIALVALVIALAALPSYAQGVVFVEKEMRSGQVSRIQMDKDRIRSESRDGRDETAFVFDGAKQTARMINITKKTYTEITKSDMEQMRGQMNSAMSQMQEQLRNLPPAERAMVEQMMQGRGMPGMPGMPGGAGMPGMAAPAKIEYRQSGTDKVGQWSCTKYEGYSAGQKTSEVCTVDPKEFGLSAADFDAARQLAEFMKALVPEMADRAFVNGTGQDQGFSGVPVRRVSIRNNAVESTTEITEFRREVIPASVFETPSGFKKESMGRGR